MEILIMQEEKFQRLSEGMDFIEEACGFSEPLVFEEVAENLSELIDD